MDRIVARRIERERIVRERIRRILKAYGCGDLISEYLDGIEDCGDGYQQYSRMKASEIRGDYDLFCANI